MSRAQNFVPATRFFMKIERSHDGILSPRHVPATCPLVWADLNLGPFAWAWRRTRATILTWGCAKFRCRVSRYSSFRTFANSDVKFSMGNWMIMWTLGVKFWPKALVLAVDVFRNPESTASTSRHHIIQRIPYESTTYKGYFLANVL